jgi:DNA-binding NtrC family response regulator
VLLTGETGVGKEVVAHLIHQRGLRKAAPFIAINCAGVPDSLLESSLFGHKRGSFTDAYRDRPGLLREAHSGTVFLDEVGEMTSRMQALLLRFLETGETQMVGASVATAPIDVRVITATNRDLPAEVRKGTFREDLYYRLNVLHVHIPPLRERGPDIGLLTEHYAGVFAEQYQRPVPTFTAAAMQLLCEYAWPGNIRELKNVIERAVLNSESALIEPADLPPEIQRQPSGGDEGARLTPAGSGTAQPARVDEMLAELAVPGCSFWNVVYSRFMSRDITRDDVRHMVKTGLDATEGSYRRLLEHWHMDAADYQRFTGFLADHECDLGFQRSRTSNETRRVAAGSRR